MNNQLRNELLQLSSSQLRELLHASGHSELLRDVKNEKHEVDEQLVTEAKNEGNAFFNCGCLHDAVSAYSRCIDMDPNNAVCLSNRAAAYLKLNEFELALADCTKAIEIVPTIKPFMRRAMAHLALTHYEEAVADFAAALKFEPRNKECYAQLQTIVDSATNAQQHDSMFSTKLRRAGIHAMMIVSVRDGWSVCAVRGNPGPAAVNGHTLFRGYNERIYLFGGRAVREQKPDVFVLDESDNSSWDIVPTRGVGAPLSCAWHSTSVIGKKEKNNICVYGGVSSQGEDASVHLLVPTTSRDFEWVQAHCAQNLKEIPASRSGHAAVSIIDSNDDQAVYIFGGRTKRGVSDQLLILHLSSIQHEKDVSNPIHATITWEEVCPCDHIDTVGSRSFWPSARDGHSMCYFPSTGNQAPRLIVFGGNGQLNDDKKNDVWLYDLETQLWTFFDCFGDCPTPRSYHTAHAVGNFLLVVCGRTADSEDDGVYMLDIEGAEWHKLPIPSNSDFSPRAWHSSILTEAGKLFVLGGGTFHGPLKSAAILDLGYFHAQAPLLSHH
ncbi:FOG: TPR repeat [Plasmopara halstedii]|uniref:FOG: TPR repeat n=1 Tax=Plasmopara halstedii TaxID=4781 RepID=A0A0P1ADB5_PLAHL|nr:FOG: TPR repeat [Plasmopara halstedii]CEG38697.1 FOG: TPR repeat [Plasmopara halstedii]|eukprot:XP_024575066.1 FOG: TPR repeat [Plasmopara halstedii]